jgi:hypothetical protein
MVNLMQKRCPNKKDVNMCLQVPWQNVSSEDTLTFRVFVKAWLFLVSARAKKPTANQSFFVQITQEFNHTATFFLLKFL